LITVLCEVYCTHEGEEKCCKFWWENPKETDYLEDPGVDGRIISEWILKK